MTETEPQPQPRRRRPRGRRRGIGLLLLVAAVLTELAKPAAKRTWEGRILGVLPYDLRRPTVKRVRERMWNPRDRRILVPTVFGVGWTVNAGSLLKRLRSS